ncbi:b(0,+)-type amino acid transporter 1-like [Patiria miniata]|uniref:b(0,+)-type amino acid transporter 1 n=1 Tax=Patiria miniata TaxID=46514 RepID=A0A914A902_PATMI|nr:b(0,+)-type amino acid transporter 1-like [Patiria miniata]
MTADAMNEKKGSGEPRNRGSLESSNTCDENENMDSTVKLKREIGLVRAVSLIIGAMIGSGIFISPKGVLLATNSVGMSLVVWFICAVVSSLGAMCFAELGAVVPLAGGPYQYALHAYGNLPGFMVAWSLVVIMMPAGVAMTAITLGTYTSDYVIPGDCAPPREAIQLFAILSVMLIVFINCVSVRVASGLSVVFSGAKVIALMVIIIAGLVKVFQGHTEYLDPSVSFEGSTTQFLGYGLAFYNGLWAYAGWEILNSVTEELKNPGRNIPLAIGIAIPAVTIIYLLTNIAYFTTLSPTELLASSAVAVTFAERTLGPMAWVIPVGVCISTFGNLLGNILASPRIAFAAGREGHMLKVLSMINVKRLTPLPAIVLQAIIAIILILLGDFNSILKFASFVSYIFHGAAFMAVLILRRKYPDKPRPFRVNVLIPIFATAVCVFMILAPLIAAPTLEYLYALVLLAIGLVVYLVFVWGKRQLPFMNQMTLFYQKLFLVSPSRY